MCFKFVHLYGCAVVHNWVLIIRRLGLHDFRTVFESWFKQGFEEWISEIVRKSAEKVRGVTC